MTNLATPAPAPKDGDRELVDEALAAVQEATERRLEPWAAMPLRRCIRRFRDIGNLVDIAREGIALLPGRPRLVEALDNLDRVMNQDEADSEDKNRAREHRLASSRLQANLALSEIDTDFPLLHTLGSVWLWTSLETLVEDLMVAVLANDPTTTSLSSVRDLRVPLAVAASGDTELVAWAAYKELEARKGAAFQSGVTRFEGLLDVVGLGGPVPDEVRKRIFELGQVRNVALHRGGIADRPFVEACPWTGHAVGDPLRIGHVEFTRFLYTAIHYEAVVHSRASTKYPLDAATPDAPVAAEATGEP